MKRVLRVTILCVAGIAQSVYAGGYLNSMGTGINVTGYMSNNNVGLGPSTGLTIFVSGIFNPDSCANGQ